MLKIFAYKVRKYEDLCKQEPYQGLKDGKNQSPETISSSYAFAASCLFFPIARQFSSSS